MRISLGKVILRCAFALLLVGSFAQRGYAAQLDVYDFDDGTTQGWTTEGAWDVTNETSNSGTFSLGDSPGGTYADNTDTSATTPVIDLTNSIGSRVDFMIRGDVRSGDTFTVSSWDGTNLQQLVSLNTGANTGGNFVSVGFDLGTLDGEANVSIVFQLVTNGDGLAGQGIHIDDVVFSNSVCSDLDGDGFFAEEGCGTTVDCNDNDANINPDTTWYEDLDGDGFGNPNVSLIQCTQPVNFVLDNTDCDDGDANEYYMV